MSRVKQPLAEAEDRDAAIQRIERQVEEEEKGERNLRVETASKQARRYRGRVEGTKERD